MRLLSRNSQMLSFTISTISKIAITSVLESEPHLMALKSKLENRKIN